MRNAALRPKVSWDISGTDEDFWWQGAGSWLGSLLPFGYLGTEVPVLHWLPPRAEGAGCLPIVPLPSAASHPLLPLQKQTEEGTVHGPCTCKCLFKIPAV